MFVLLFAKFFFIPRHILYANDLQNLTFKNLLYGLTSSLEDFKNNSQNGKENITKSFIENRYTNLKSPVLTI